MDLTAPLPGTAGVILVLVVGEDAEEALAGHLQQGVLAQVGVAGVVQGGGEVAAESQALVELAEQQQAAVGGELVAAILEVDGQAGEKVDGLGPGSRYTHRGPLFG